MFTDTGFWDTFRSLFPLLNLLYPSINNKIQQGLANAYRESGFLPEWASPGHRDCMVGNNSASVIADAIINGVTTEDKDILWQAVTHGANAVHPRVNSTGRLGWEYYNSLGYIPCDVGINESAARTLEYAYDDWCIAQYALAEAGRKGSRVADTTLSLDSVSGYYGMIAKEYMRRAQSWMNVIDAQGFMHARRNGGFITPFDPTEVNNHYTEANSWQYSSYVPHDVPAWIEMMGGKAKAEAFLDSLFNTSSKTSGRDQSDITGMIGQYAHGNEPSHHAAYLYAFLGAPDKLDATVHQVLEELYAPTPDGLCGNEDCGQMSAWYVFSALGFYPFDPCGGEYVVGAPQVAGATVALPGGRTLRIEVRNFAKENTCVESVSLNGKPVTDFKLRHADLMKGGTLTYVMRR